MGQTVALTAAVAPSNATDKTVTYSSSAEATATVDGNGVVTGIAAGEATITVTTNDGNQTDTCVVIVTAAAGG